MKKCVKNNQQIKKIIKIICYSYKKKYKDKKANTQKKYKEKQNSKHSSFIVYIFIMSQCGCSITNPPYCVNMGDYASIFTPALRYLVNEEDQLLDDSFIDFDHKSVHHK